MKEDVQIPPSGFDVLTIDEKIAYVQSLWDHIAADAETVPVQDWQMKILNERLAELEADPDSTIPWEDVLNRLSNELKTTERGG